MEAVPATIESREALISEPPMLPPGEPVLAKLEYGFTLSLAAFLVWWVVSSLSRKLDEIGGLLDKQERALERLERTVEEQAELIKEYVEIARNTHNLLTTVHKDLENSAQLSVDSTNRLIERLGEFTAPPRRGG